MEQIPVLDAKEKGSTTGLMMVGYQDTVTVKIQSKINRMRIRTREDEQKAAMRQGLLYTLH